MNNFQTKKATIGIALLLIIISCNKEELLGRFSLAFTNRLVVNVANIQVIDAVTNKTFEDNILVEIVGTPSASIYDMYGDDTLKYIKKIINVGVSPDNVPKPGKSLTFTLRISHKFENYVPAIVSITILSDRVEDRIVRLLKLSNLPSSVKVGLPNPSNVQAGSTPCSTSAAITFQTQFKNMEVTTVTIPSGTIFFKSGKAMCGKVGGELISFDLNYEPSHDSVAVIRFFPGGLAYQKAVDASGKNFGGGLFTTHGFFSLHLTVDGVPVDSFSKPAEVSVEMTSIRKRTLEIGNNTGVRALKNGDFVPIWSSKEGSQWVAEALPMLTNNKMIFNINHPGWWNMADPSCIYLYNWFDRRFINNEVSPSFSRCPPCPAKLTFQVQKGVNSNYYTEISLAGNDKLIIASPMIPYKDSIVLDLTGYLGVVDAGVKLNFKVYDKEPWNLGTPLYFKNGFSPCNDEGTLGMKSVPFPQYASIATDFHLVCGNPDGTTSTLSPSASLYVKEVVNGIEQGLWNYIGTIRNGKGVTMSKLQCGKTYKFNVLSSPAFTTDEIDIYQDSTQIPRPSPSPSHDITIPANCNTDFWVKFVRLDWGLNKKVFMEYLGNKEYKMLLTEWRPDSVTCAKYRKRF